MRGAHNIINSICHWGSTLRDFLQNLVPRSVLVSGRSLDLARRGWIDCEYAAQALVLLPLYGFAIAMWRWERQDLVDNRFTGTEGEAVTS